MKLFGFLFRLFIIVVVVVWIVNSPGETQIVWRDKIIEMSSAVFILVAMAVAYGLLQLSSLWRLIWDGPKIWRLKRRARDLEDGQKEIAKGLAAIAGGDAAKAGVHALRARRLLGEVAGVRLLQAQAAQLAGDHGAAKSLYTAMTTDPDTVTLGFRGLIMAALRAGDHDQALALAGRLEKEKGECPWLHALKFQINARLENWKASQTALEKARRTRAIPKVEANRYEAAVLLAQAKDALKDSKGKEALAFAEKARSLAPGWVPAALTLIEAQIVIDSTGSALRMIEKTWRKTPHPQLVPLALWAAQAEKPIEGFKYIRKLVRGAPQEPVALMALAEAALKADLWGEARRALMAVLARGAGTHLTYQMLARLERHETGDEKAASSWLARGLAAPPDPAWLCGACGAAHAYWDASCSACGAFDKMMWGQPGKARPLGEAAIGALLTDALG